MDEYGFLIEILISGKFFVPDGWEGLETTNFWEAFQYYQQIKLTN